MTTIAWDGKTLAVDRGSWQGYIANRVNKLRNVGGGNRRPGQSWIALAGDAHIAEATWRWLLGSDWPRLLDADYNKVCGVLVTTEREIFRVSAGMETFEQILDVPFADGGGADMALGAMLAGATAAKAVELVATRSNLSWGGVDSVNL